jgi:glycine/D-amino acid oxidase-like deaminating enzyme
MRVAILGGGLQGACVAMELADAGVEVDLYDRNGRCLTQASARNEGKIHLGYVYAHDTTLETARTMIRGAASFCSSMRKWLGSEIDRVPVSRPFQYAVHRDSMLTTDAIAHHLSACCRIAREQFPRGFDYFGQDCHDPPVRLADLHPTYDGGAVAAAFRTPEIGIDTEILADLVRARLMRDPNIRCILRAEVLRVTANGRRHDVMFAIAGDAFSEGYDHVVNALWDGRLAIDATVGIAPTRPWLFRMKYYARVRAPGLKAVPSTTIVLGPFGDLVDFGGDFYLSWYPAGATGRSSATTPPDWPRTLPEREAEDMLSSIIAGLATVLPGLAGVTRGDLDAWAVKGGVIFAWGATDIDDPQSGLHERANIGPQRHGRYHSVNTGKLTTAPLFGKLAAQNILA